MRVLVPHALAVVALLGLGLFFAQPIGGHIAFWTPGDATVLVIAAMFIVGGCFAWWRFAWRRALIVGDALALVPIAYVSLLIFVLPVTLTVAAMLVVGVAGARTHDAEKASSVRQAANVHRVALVAAVAIAGFFALTALGTAFSRLGGMYGLIQVAVAGVFGFAVLFWLDGRPGALLGGSLAVLYFAGELLLGGQAPVPPDVLLLRVALFVAGSVVALATAWSVWKRAPVGRLASTAVAAITLAALVATFTIPVGMLPIASPVVFLLALLIERPARRPVPNRDAREPAASEPASA
jgi:hypothetical protein